MCLVGSYSDVYGVLECILCFGLIFIVKEGIDSVVKCNGSVLVLLYWWSEFFLIVCCIGFF